MTALAPALAELSALLDQGAPTTVRMTASNPPPPRHIRGYPVAETRLILCMEGDKTEDFAEAGHAVSWRMRPGDLLVVRPQSWLCPSFASRHRHFGVVAAGKSLRAAWCRCDGHPARAQPLTIEASFELPLAERGPLQRTLAALTAIGDARADQDAARHLACACLRLLLGAAAQPAEDPGGAEASWRRVRDHVIDHYQSPVTRAGMASAFAISPNYLSRLCRMRAGCSFIDFVNGVRLERAAGMLRAMDVPVGEVARACGFSDPGYFIRRFRRAYGCTPGAFRRTPG